LTAIQAAEDVYLITLCERVLCRWEA